ncbi:MAG: SGNH/GDSL hydrolase family protein [Bacteroidales bacterium]|nr:SGNH/GDSL hydrolase family protein [Bacteroidales bacterium]MBP5796178.1 SGNH/GDSL hydrolase family protein [Bacteroidales bacterium]
MKAFRFLRLAAATLVITLCLCGSASARRWVTTWATAQQIAEPHNNPPIPLAGETLRQIVQVSIGGSEIRLRFSNRFSQEDLELVHVDIAEAQSEGASPDIFPDTSKSLTFNGKESITIKAGEEVFSDPVRFRLKERMNVAITITYGKAPANIITGHPGSRTTSYFLGKNTTTDHWYTIESIQVKAGRKAGAIAVLGDSITDGRGTTTNGQNRWTDNLSKRLLANWRTRKLSVLNLGLGGNCVFLEGGNGPVARSRYQHDLLDMEGVKYIILFEGVNDLGTCKDGMATAEELILTFTEITSKAHARGIKVIGATVMPFKHNRYYNESREQGRQRLNNWIRTGGVVDGLIDFDAAMSGKEEPDALNPIYLFENDWLHPNAQGYMVMGDCIDLNLF